MKKIPHRLHQIIGEALIEHFMNYDILRDPACGGIQNIPLFLKDKKSNATESCNVDILIIKDCKIRVIIEIEESNIKPTQVCGKFLTSALSTCFIHKCKSNMPVEMHKSVTFIQIVDTSKLKKDRNFKIEQFKYLEESIQGILPLKDKRIDKYKLLTIDGSKLDLMLNILFNYVEETLV